MKKFLLFFLTVVFAFASSELLAQDRTVSGRVTSSDDGSPLPGVNVVVKGTTSGTVTNADGNFTLMAPGNGTLVFTFIGLESQEVPINDRTTVDVIMAQDVQQLSEVVVTALNIPREKASLGYATQKVSGDAVTTAKQQNFVNSLSGKLAGVQIRTNGSFGGSTNILIRGNKSVGGNNQPLFVIDGVPVDNRTGNSVYQAAGSTGYDYGNTTSDINPEDIESINVLKGAGASILYGSRAQNGVVMITTKKGSKRKGVGISVSSGVTVSKINKDTFIKYQDKYGAGYAAPSFEYYGPEGFFEDPNVLGNGPGQVVPTLEDASYGAAFDGRNVYQWDSFVPESPNYGKAYPWRAAKHTPVDFFETQMELNNSISFSGGNDNSVFRANYTNFKSNYILPNSDLKRNNFNLSASTAINEKLKASIDFNYINTNTLGRNSTGYSDNLMTTFRQWYQTNVDIKSLHDIYNKTGRNISWNGGDYTDPSHPIFWDNPYWTRFQNYQTDKRNRVFGNFALNYQATKWLSAMARVSVDAYSALREERRAVGSVPAPFGIATSSGRNDQASGYSREDIRVSENNYDFILTAKKDLSTDLSLVAVLGTNIRRNNYESIYSATNGGLVVPGLYSLNNSVLPVQFPNETQTRKEVYGLFANANLGYKDMLYLEAAVREDRSSALPVKKNAYPYYMGAFSFVFTEAFDISFLNFGKARINYAGVGNDTDPARTNVAYTKLDNFGSSVLFSYPSTVNNTNLQPEASTSLEVGVETRAINNRLSFEFDLYKTNTRHQILPVEVSKASGMGYKILNGGNIQNKGIEVSLGYDIIKGSDFKWTANLVWAKNISEVISLPSDIENYQINSYQGGVSTNATVGQPYGVIRGTGFKYLNGQKVVNAAGYYVAVADQVIGNPNPDWTGGLTNTFGYKGISLSFLIDVQHGGDVWSLDQYYGQATGLPAHTARTNDLGNPIRNAVTLVNPDDPSQGYTEDSGGVILDGVHDDGSKNTTRVRADYYGGLFYWGNATRNPTQLNTFDASYVKLRELSISYSLPKAILGNVFQRASLSLFGRNLWIIDKNVPYADPESGLGAGNGQGILSGAMPTTRSMGFKVDLTF
jgi:TonB-linked SusC/RagA family outer membrane protein